MSSRRQPSLPPKIPGYQYVRLLGMGGFADVFEYRQELPRRSVAVKVLLSGSLDQDAREAFFAEANVMAQLSHHPSIVTIYHADIAADGRPFLVMEYCSRPSLGARYRTERFTVAEVLRTGIRVGSAVEAAHRLGILHRDIKPANILATDFGWPALTDFGIASTLGSGAVATGMSIPWSAPELLAENPEGDVRGDVYSLGATLYTLLAGRSPFEIPGRGNSPAELLSRIERSPLPPIDREDVPAGLNAVVARAMTKDPDRRFVSALALAHALQQVERSMQLPVTSIDLSEDHLPEPVREPGGDPGARWGAPGAQDVVDDGTAAPGSDQATRLRPIVSIDPHGGPGPGTVAAPLPPAATLVDGPPAARTDDALGVDDQATRLRPITTISAQEDRAPVESAAPGPVVGAAPTLDSRLSLTPAVLEGTPPAPGYGVPGMQPSPVTTSFSPTPSELRARHYDSSQPRPAEGRRAPSPVRRAVAAASAVLVVAALGFVAFQTWGREAQTNPQATVEPSETPTLVGGATVPAPANLRSVTEGDSVTFSWSNPDEQEGDAYLWQLAGVGQTSRAERIEDRSVTVEVPEGESRVCIEVSVVRTDGRASTTPTQGCSA
ncbi:serine/threonine-protein kinase [Sanguibacter suaedae]|uniref:non-specific serine/threonine protein kinase n=1 Tax=Sanguibacter suaedae TaxID=2795737 RepID=A0A934IA88_9MICO|nr:serine/threonine-protein kinase [Sanguibacter suaedae]MBI9115952.1 protein kinase [Sanguibacter suaedae]